MSKRKRILQIAGTVCAVCSICLTTQLHSYAVTIGPNVKASDFDAYTIPQFQNVVLNIIFWILRVSGAVISMWGIYGVIAAKKDGDAESINQAMVKFLFGAVFLGMPGILKALKIIM